MPRKVSLSVNDNPIELDNFVEGYVYHVTAGILGSLKNTGTIKGMELIVDGDGQVEITLNGTEVPLSYFPVQIIRNTLAGMVANLKGVTGEMRTLELKITQ
ncbi:MAG: hypothetical protein JXA17_00975 [Dehalococcoidales bacterium]|nr:hypothetical protein [Dehalococcoidales bacterium]